MKISKKEAALLGILAAFFVGILYYQFVYVKQVEKIEALKVEKEEVQTEYDTIMSTIKRLDEKKGEIKVFNANIESKSKLFYPKLVQEKIILELDKLIKDSKIESSITFTPIGVGVVEVVNVPQAVEGSSTLAPIVDEYDNYMGNDGESGDIVIDTDSSETVTNVVSSGNTIEQLKVNMSYSGSYSNIKKFIDLVNSSDKQIVISNIAITQKEDQDISGSLTLEFYGIPKITDEDSEYLTWTLNNTYGKDTPFSKGGATGGTIESTVVNKEKYDFIMTTRPINSDLPTIMIGKANDDHNTSYIYSDNKGIEAVEIEISNVGEKYYYKYKTSTGSYPAIYSGEGQVFAPVNDNIVFEILSKNRIDANDLAGVNLKVINNSNKVVEVNISDDDKENPRVVVKSEGNAVKVTKK